MKRGLKPYLHGAVVRGEGGGGAEARCMREFLVDFNKGARYEYRIIFRSRLN